MLEHGDWFICATKGRNDGRGSARMVYRPLTSQHGWSVFVERRRSQPYSSPQPSAPGCDMAASNVYGPLMPAFRSRDGSARSSSGMRFSKLSPGNSGRSLASPPHSTPICSTSEESSERPMSALVVPRSHQQSPIKNASEGLVTDSLDHDVSAIQNNHEEHEVREGLWAAWVAAIYVCLSEIAIK